MRRAQTASRALLALALLASMLHAQSPNPADLAGNWLGTLEAGGAKLRLALHITRSAPGAYTGTLDSIDQGASNLPLDAITLDGSAVSITLKTPPAKLQGTLSPDASVLTATWNQGGFSAPLILHRVAETPVVAPIAYNRPQEPKPPFPYRAEDVTYPSKAPGVTLAATLTTPQSGAPFPAVLLITGSGAQDRNETLLGHKPFLVLADYLTRHGIAVLRVDDRGTAQSTGDFATAITQDFVEDAAGSVAWLRTRRDIDPHRIGLLGHSEGAIIAPLLAVRDSAISFIVMMAGTATSGDQVLKAQAAAIMQAEGNPEAAIAQNSAVQDAVFRFLRQLNGAAPNEAQVSAAVDEMLLKLPEAQRAEARPALLSSLHRWSSPWFRYFVFFDPTATLSQLKTPVLALNGSLDKQVLASQNLPLLARDLEAAGNPDYQIVKLPNLNHLFQTAQTGAVSEYVRIDETIAPVALETITAWITRHTQPPAAK